jgi:hypothetical protein
MSPGLLKVHTVKAFADLTVFVSGCRVAPALSTAE